MRKTLKIGVIGAGVFGGYHAAKCAAHPRLDLVGIFDPNHDKVRIAAKKHGTNPYDNCNTLLADAKAVIVACPAIHHGPIAIAALKAGRHVLVEKPLAASLDMATTMVDLADDNNLVLQVGHQERFVARAIGLDSLSEKPLSITAIRSGPPSRRGSDVSVTLDLMTHDLDMALWLMGTQPVSIKGDTLAVHSNTADAARADLVFANGTKVRLEASRTEPDRVRKMRLEYKAGTVEIDFVAKTLKDTTGFGLNQDFADHPLAHDALGAATSAFAASVLDGAPIAASGASGRDAVALALKIDAGGG